MIAPGGSDSLFYVLDEPVRILFADDDPILREFAQVHLATADNAVLVAGDGVEACEVLDTQAVDILLLDLQMPRMDGFDVLKRIRADERLSRLPVIVVTGREDIVAIDQAFETGATSFIVKPINWRLLTYQLRFILRAHRAETALVAERARAADEAAEAHESLRRLAHEGATMLSLAMQSEGPLRAAAKRYADSLRRTVEADPRRLRSDAA